MSGGKADSAAWSTREEPEKSASSAARCARSLDASQIRAASDTLPASCDGPYNFYRLRSSSYDAIYLSPHLDDAVYSCGGQMLLQRAENKRVLVITVFGNGSDREPGPAGDRFRDFAERKREELAAMNLLDVDFLFLNLPDALHRRHSAREVVRICLPFLPLASRVTEQHVLPTLEALSERLLAPSGMLFFPLGVGSHPDHRLVFDAGRTLHARAKYAVCFYEDVAYVHVKGMLEDRLRSLGMKVNLPFFSFVRGVHGFFLRRAAAWQRWFSWPLLFAFLLLRSVLQATTGLADRRPWEGDLSPVERDITNTVRAKVAAMRAYTTQTEYFFSAGEALLRDLRRSGQRFVERYWHFPAPRLVAATTPPSHFDAEARKVDALLRAAGQAATDGFSGFATTRFEPSRRDGFAGVERES